MNNCFYAGESKLIYIIVSTHRLPALTSSPFLWNIHRPLSQLLSPTERFPHDKQSLLCVWNRRGQHSSPQAPNKTQILAEIIQIPTGRANPIRFSKVAASLKVDNQCLCEAIRCQQAEWRERPLAPSQSCSVSCADALLTKETLDYFARAIRTRAGLSEPGMAFLCGIWMFLIFFYKLKLMSCGEAHQLFRTTWPQHDQREKNASPTKR